jgi:uncharacterized protein YlxP (DUF503 family)
MGLVIGVLQVEIRIDWAHSLKDKRRVIQSLIARLRQGFRVSVAEVDHQDDHRVATLGVVLAASEGKQARSTLDKILDALRGERDCVLADHTTEILSGA